MGCNTSSSLYEKLAAEAPEGRTTIFSRLTFGFLSSIIETGNKRPLEATDFSSLELESTQYLTEKLEREWQNELKIRKERCSQPRLRRALLKTADKTLITLIVLLAFLDAFCRMIQPVVLSFLLTEMSNSSSLHVNILVLYSALLSVSCFVQTFASHHASYSMFLMAVQVKASLIGLIYKKVSRR